MRNVPANVMAHPLNLTWQAIFTWTSWALVLVMVGVAVALGLRQRTPFYLFAVLAAGVAAFAEPLYDVAYDLWFYDAHADSSSGAMWSHFSAFGVVQPNWTHSGYIVLYSAAALYAGRQMYEGQLSRRGLFAVWGIEILSSVAFEVIGTGVNVYTYYGPFELRIWHYPVAIGVLEGTQTVLFTVLAVQIWRRVHSSWALASLFAAFPMTMFGTNFGIGAPLIIALHLDPPSFSSAWVWVATFLSMALCVLAINGAWRFLPKLQGAPETDVSAVAQPAALASA